MLLTLLAGAIGFGGMFAMYTYIAPTVTEVAGLRECVVPLYLLAFGARRGARYAVGRAPGRLVGPALDGARRGRRWALTLVALHGDLAVVRRRPGHGVRCSASVGSVLVVNLQMRLMQVAGNAQTLGAALNHASLNIANALGAWLGGLVVAAGLGYTVDRLGRRRAVAARPARPAASRPPCSGVRRSRRPPTLAAYAPARPHSWASRS